MWVPHRYIKSSKYLQLILKKEKKIMGGRKHRNIPNLRGISRIESEICLLQHEDDIPNLRGISRRESKICLLQHEPNRLGSHYQKLPKSFKECYCQKNNFPGLKETVNVRLKTTFLSPIIH